MRIDYPRRGRTGVRHWLPSWRQLLSLAALGFVAVVGVFAVLVARTTVPEPNDVATAQTTIVYWGDGRTELGRLGDANRVSVPLEQVPLTMQHAVLSAEDREFYDEGGFSPKGIGRAIWNNVSGGSTQGGSTITQQYAKNAFLTQERTFTRKFSELILAVKLDTSVSKDQILGDYLNTIYFGRGAYGIESASRSYFGKSVSKLTLGESAALAAIIRSPGGYAPETNLPKLQGRWNYVLDGMVEKGWITPAERATATFPTFVKKKSANKYAGPNGYLLAAVQQSLAARGFTEDDVNRGGLRVVSTFDKQAQAAAIVAVREQGPKSGTDGPAHRPRGGEARDRRGRRDVRRRRLPHQPGQQRDPGARPGRLDVQAVRARGRDRGRRHARLDVERQHRRRDRRLQGQQLRRRVARSDHPAQGHRAVGQLRLRRACPRRSATTRWSTPPCAPASPRTRPRSHRSAPSRSASPRRT